MLSVVLYLVALCLSMSMLHRLIKIVKTHLKRNLINKTWNKCERNLTGASITEALPQIIPHCFTAFFRTSLQSNDFDIGEISYNTEQRSSADKHSGYRHLPLHRRWLPPNNHCVYCLCNWWFIVYVIGGLDSNFTREIYYSPRKVWRWSCFVIIMCLCSQVYSYTYAFYAFYTFTELNQWIFHIV